MEIFEWNPNYATGIAEIDEQHAYLFALTNRLIRQSAGEPEGQVIEGILGELNAYVEKHFSYEESMLQKIDYRFLDEHKQQHLRMRESLTSYENLFRKNELSTADLVDFLKLWLRLHILREDMKYVPSLAALKDKI